MGSELEVSAVETPVTAAEVLTALHNAAPDLNRATLAVLVAQVALETGRFHRCMNYNLGGLKSGPDRMHTYFATTEVLPISQALWDRDHATSAAPVKIVRVDGAKATLLYSPRHDACRFRAYESLGDAAIDYLSLLRARFGRAWPAAEAGDPGLFVERLHDLGYFTGSLDAYKRAVTSIFHELTRVAA